MCRVDLGGCEWCYGQSASSRKSCIWCYLPHFSFNIFMNKNLLKSDNCKSIKTHVLELFPSSAFIGTSMCVWLRSEPVAEKHKIYFRNCETCSIGESSAHVVSRLRNFFSLACANALKLTESKQFLILFVQPAGGVPAILYFWCKLVCQFVDTMVHDWLSAGLSQYYCKNLSTIVLIRVSTASNTETIPYRHFCLPTW